MHPISQPASDGGSTLQHWPSSRRSIFAGSRRSGLIGVRCSPSRSDEATESKEHLGLFRPGHSSMRGLRVTFPWARVAAPLSNLLVLAQGSLVHRRRAARAAGGLLMAVAT